MAVKQKRHRALVGLQFADGSDDNGQPVEHRVEPGELVPTRFDIPDEWYDRKVEEA